MYNLRRRVMVSDITPEIQNGVYAYYSNGTLRTYADADTNAIGVAVVTDYIKLVIDKYATSATKIQFGGHGKDLSNIGVMCTNSSTVAKTDYNGESNTVKIINALNGYTDSYGVTGAPACEVCKNAFNGNGYLGSLGEWYQLYQYKSDIDSMIKKIGGNSFLSVNTRVLYTSTLYTDNTRVWRLYWDDGTINTASSGRSGGAYAARALMKL
jgi:hypothetical protein